LATISNTNLEDFGDLAGANLTITHVSLIFNYGQGNELLAVTGALTTPRSFVQGDPLEFPVGSFVGTFPNGAFGAAFLKAVLDALIAARGAPTVLLGTAAMGSDGKQNEVSDSGYSRQTMELTTAE